MAKTRSGTGKKILHVLLIGLFAFLFVFSAYQIVRYYREASRAQDIYEKLREMTAVDHTDAAHTTKLASETEDFPAVTDGTTASRAEASASVTDGTTASAEEKTPAVMLKFSDLYAINPDLWGWIRIEGTQIDYPVMHTPSDPEYYLRRAFDKSDLISGTPFLEGRCFDGCGNYIIYGHHMKNKANSMFGILPEYAKKNFWEKHRIIHLETLYESAEYEVVAAFYSEAYGPDEDGFRYHLYSDLTDPDVFNEYVENVKSVSLYGADFDIAYGDELLTLSTCNYHTEDGRFAVVAKKRK